MKKKIAIWCCLAIVLVFSIYQIIFISDLLNKLYIMYKEIGLSVKESGSYIIYRNSLVGFILNAIVCVVVSCLIFYFKDATSEELKMQIEEIKQKHNIDKEIKKQKKLEKLENKIKELKGD